jgi:nucleoside-diphosphate-sugar epimerase
MNVFLAGGSGAIGVPLVRALVAAGHQVTASSPTFSGNWPRHTDRASPAYQYTTSRPGILGKLRRSRAASR